MIKVKTDGTFVNIKDLTQQLAQNWIAQLFDRSWFRILAILGLYKMFGLELYSKKDIQVLYIYRF